MALTEERRLSALTAHWNIETGVLKPPTIEYATFVAKDGVPIAETIKRETAQIADVAADPLLQQLIPAALAQAQARIMELEAAAVVAQERIGAAEPALAAAQAQLAELGEALAAKDTRIAELDAALSAERAAVAAWTAAAATAVARVAELEAAATPADAGGSGDLES
jgi:hypothetical protein